jgi:hypothetical protein
VVEDRARPLHDLSSFGPAVGRLGLELRNRIGFHRRRPFPPSDCKNDRTVQFSLALAPAPVYVKGNRPNGSVSALECFQVSQKRSMNAAAPSELRKPLAKATMAVCLGGAARGESLGPTLNGASPPPGGELPS